MQRPISADLLEQLRDDALHDASDDVTDQEDDQEADELGDEREERVKAQAEQRTGNGQTQTQPITSGGTTDGPAGSRKVR